MVAWGTLSAWVKQAELDAGLRGDGLDILRSDPDTGTSRVAGPDGPALA